MKKFLIASSVAGAVGLYMLLLLRVDAAAEERDATVFVAAWVSGLERSRNLMEPPVMKQEMWEEAYRSMFLRYLWYNVSYMRPIIHMS
jgi:hypothetical protein